MRAKVYVGDLLESVHERDLAEKFSKYGHVDDVWVSHNPPGYAFVVFSNTHDAERAVRKLDGRNLCGSRVRVEISRKDLRLKERHSDRRRSHATSASPYPTDYSRFVSPHRRRSETSERYSRRSGNYHYRSPLPSTEVAPYAYMPPMPQQPRSSPRRSTMEYHSPLESLPPYHYPTYPEYYQDVNYYNSYAPGYYTYPVATDPEADYRNSAVCYAGMPRPQYYEAKPVEYATMPAHRTERAHGRLSEKSSSGRSHHSVKRNQACDNIHTTPPYAGSHEVDIHHHHQPAPHVSQSRHRSPHHAPKHIYEGHGKPLTPPGVPRSRESHSHHRMPPRSRGHHTTARHRRSSSYGASFQGSPPTVNQPIESFHQSSPQAIPSQHGSLQGGRRRSLSAQGSITKFRSPTDGKSVDRRCAKSPHENPKRSRDSSRDSDVPLKHVGSCHDYNWEAAPEECRSKEKYRSSGSSRRAHRTSKTQV